MNILNELISSLIMVATLQNFLAIVAGIWAGVIIGAIPGMTGTMAVTLALPFTFYMSPITSLLLLVALYKGSTYGGSISAILIKHQEQLQPPVLYLMVIQWHSKGKQERHSMWHLFLHVLVILFQIYHYFS